jgi:hypothetical protein
MFLAFWVRKLLDKEKYMLRAGDEIHERGLDLILRDFNNRRQAPPLSSARHGFAAIVFAAFTIQASYPTNSTAARVAGITAPGGSVLCGCHVYRYALIVASAAAFAVAFTVASASIAAFISISAFISIPAYASASCHHHPACTADVHPFSFSLF